MDDFIFDGVHISTMGATAAFGDSTNIGTRIDRREYAMPDGSSVEIGEPGYGVVTRNITILPRDGVTANEEWARAILTWLTRRRGKMIMLRDPGVYRIAQFDGAMTYGWRSWPGGMLEVKCTMQGLAHAVRTSSFVRLTQGGTAQIIPAYATGVPSPLRVEISPTSGTISEAAIAAGGKTVELSRLNLAQGQTLIYEAGDGHGKAAEISVDGVLAFDCCDRWAKLEAASGDTIGVTLTGGEADVSVVLRGRWIG